MSLRSVLISILVAGALGALVILDAAFIRSGGVDKEPPQRVTIGVDTPAIVRLTLQHATGEHQTLERAPDRPGSWELTLPGAAPWPADGARVRLALRTLTGAPIEPERDKGPSDPEWIADSPGLVRLETRDGASCEIAFDARSVARLRRVRVTNRDEDGIVTRRLVGRIDEGIAESFLVAGMDSWRDPSLFPSSPSRVGALTLTAGASRVTLGRDGASWSITDPWRVGAEPGAVDETLRSVLALSAESFPDPGLDPAATGLDTPRATIRVLDRSRSESATLAIGVPSSIDASRVYASYSSPGGDDRGTLVEVSSERVGKLTASPEAYIQRAAVKPAPSRIDSIRVELSGEGRSWTATREFDAWRVNADPVTPGEERSIERFLETIANTPAQEIAAPSGEPVDPGAPVLHVLSLADGEDVRFALALETGGAEPVLKLRRLDAPGEGFVWIYRAGSLERVAPWLGSRLDPGRAAP